ncbi:hypothetical protein COLO4_07346 [Corchorus olitorius]|uniref:Uncharacterized protein n=1 Tax=Corchorus olitorius TaxID=93759 RepID=A0A1R3KK30_9ROSI|nr:hypothetical protein COLO4_07346 [Corchorus olitorius]
MASPINHLKIRTNPPTSIQSLVRSSLSTSTVVPTSITSAPPIYKRDEEERENIVSNK